MQKLTFLMFCCSRPGGVAKHKNSVPALGAVHFFFCLAPSLRFAFLVFATPLVRECLFCASLLRMCCWHTGFSPPGYIRDSSNMCLRIRMVDHVWFWYFSRARDFTTQCLCHPSQSNLFFHSRRLCWHENELPALEVSRKSILSFPPSLPFTFFCCSRPRCRSQFWFFQPLHWNIACFVENDTERNVWRPWISQVANPTRVFR